jgi:hypothetical protein
MLEGLPNTQDALSSQHYKKRKKLLLLGRDEDRTLEMYDIM